MLFKQFKILQNILFNNVIQRSLNTSQLGLFLSPDLFNNSIDSRQSQAISFHLIAMINQLIWFVDIVVIYSVHVFRFELYILYIPTCSRLWYNISSTYLLLINFATISPVPSYFCQIVAQYILHLPTYSRLWHSISSTYLLILDCGTVYPPPTYLF